MPPRRSATRGGGERKEEMKTDENNTAATTTTTTTTGVSLGSDFVQFITEHPEAILKAQHASGNARQELGPVARDYTKQLFDSTSTTYLHGKSLGPLQKLLIDGFDDEQIWEEICLNTDPLLEFLESGLSELSTQLNQKKSKQQSQQIENGFDDDEEGDNDDEDLDDDLDEEMFEDDDEEGLTVSEGKNAGRGAHAVGTGMKGAKADEMDKVSSKDKKHAVEDDFFSLKEMESFVADAETSQVNDSDEDVDDDELFFGDGDGDEDGDEDDEDDGDDDADDDVADDDGDDDGDDNNEDLDEDGMDEDMDQDEMDNERRFAEELEGMRPKDLFAESSDEDDGGESKFQKKVKSIKKTIDDLETTLVGDQHWSMKGEVTSKSRPKDSLLEADLEFDRPTKVTPVITAEVTSSIEDIIKQRIKDRAFNDVEKKEINADILAPAKELPEVSQEKSSKSLGELYEEDFIKKRDAGKTAEVELTQGQKYILKTFKELCHKLDALSNYHFKPKPIQEDIEVVPNAPAVIMEEIIPSSTSDARLLAPEELYNKPKHMPLGNNEKTKADKKRELSQKKNQKKKEKKAKLRKEELVSKVNPGLGNKYAKQRALESLQKGKLKNVTVADKGTKTNFSSSAVFAQLQKQQESQARAPAAANPRPNKKARTDSASYKL